MEVRGCYMGGGGGGVDEVSRKNGSFAKHLMVCSLPWAPLQETLTFHKLSKKNFFLTNLGKRFSLPDSEL